VRLDGTGREMSGEELRVAVGRRLGWSRLPSARFTVEKRGLALHFAGAGFGHGVGLCEAGAAELARRGADARAILGRYLPGAEVGFSP
jgi:stage II sporulation protein D